MYAIHKWALPILFIILLSCNQHNVNNKKVVTGQKETSAFIKSAMDINLSIGKRMNAALKADSLATLQNDTNVLPQVYNTLGSLYQKAGNALKAKYYFILAIKVAHEPKDAGIAWNDLGNVYNSNSDYDSALYCYDLSLKIYQTVSDTPKIGKSLGNIGIALTNKGRFDSAFKVSLDAAKILEPLKDKKELAKSYTNLGTVLKELNRNDEALQYHNMALQLWQDENDSNGIASALNNIANTFRHKGDLNRALSFYNQSLRIKEKKGTPKSLGTTIDNIAEVYAEQGDYTKAEENFLKALSLRKNANDKYGILTTSNRLAKVYLQQKNITKALDLALKAKKSAVNTGMLEQKLENDLLLIQIYETLNQFPTALNYSKKALSLKDSLYNIKAIESTNQLNIKFQTSQKQKQIEADKRLQASQASSILNQRLWIGFFIIAVIGLIIIVLLAYRLVRFSKREKVQKEMLMYELNHRVKNNLQLMSSMLQTQVDRIENPSEAAILGAALSRIDSMTIIHSQLYMKEYTGAINIKDFIEALILHIQAVNEDKAKFYQTTNTIEDLQVNVNTAIYLGLIINELLTNIYKHTTVAQDQPVLRVEFGKENSMLFLKIYDNGKEWVAKNKGGSGLSLINTFTRQIKAKLATQYENGTIQIITLKK